MLAVVSDSSPLIYLTRLGVFSLLRQLHDQVNGAGRPESDNLKRAANEGWVLVQSPTKEQVSLQVAAGALGQGEIEAILLAKELGALLLTDGSDARRVAEVEGIKVSGTIGVLIRGKAAGHLKVVGPLLKKLISETNFRMSSELYHSALTQAGEA